MGERGADGRADESLFRRMRAGDESAFQSLFDRHVPEMSARVRRMLPAAVQRKVSVSDVVQEARIAAHGRRRDFENRHGNALRAWLLKIAELKARQAVRRYGGTAKRAAAREVSRNGRADTAGFAHPGPSPSQAAMDAELATIALRAMAALPPDYREVLRLARIEGLTLAEVADRMGRSREAAKKLYGRALARFTELFEGMAGGA